MEPEVKSARAPLIAALLCGIWFLLTGWMWTFLICLVISYPVAGLGLYFWRVANTRDPRSKVNRAARWLLTIGLVVSVGAIFLFKIKPPLSRPEFRLPT